MAHFHEPDDYQRLDYRLLQNGSVVAYYRQQVLDEDVAWLAAHGYRVDRFDCSTWDSKDRMFNAFATTLDFPDYFGENLDALNDCLSDVEVPEEGGRVLVFHRYDAFAAIMPEIAWHVLDIIQNNSWGHLLFGRRFFALIQSDDATISFDAVGARSVTWNWREAMNASRGL